ncbi:baseplate J/gp47 family protein [Cupriavidus pauculus]|uniref:Baseplate protein n=1 Tax=Cupriavidus pauculus TaxID=82633 RepID=A0A3G8H3G8_9BURK|nr:baseplate J/gp47 family protein [Cupriavidus pauculus]AZG14926.1 baseplate protein [Cupriavidus pauculus]
MAISTKDFTTLVREQVTAVQGYARVLVDLTVGSVFRAIVETSASGTVWLQSLILQVLAITRAATSSGSDLDSWVGDFGVTRLPATFATGQVTFSRFTPAQQAVVPVGATVQTGDGSQQYSVVADASSPAYNATLGGYVAAAGVASVTVPVVAVSAGSAGNAIAGAVSVISGAIAGIDTVTNAADFSNGADAESDPALRTRFVAYVRSLSKATKDAVRYAVTSLQQGVTVSLVENQTYAGAVQMGYFYAVVDDGTGAPTGTFLSTVANAIDAVRPLCSSFGVFAPVLVGASVSMTVTVAAGYDPAATRAVVSDALKSYINSLVRDPTTQVMTLPYSRLAQVAYDASPGVTNVTAVTLNGGASDLTANAKQVIKWTSVTVL